MTDGDRYYDSVRRAKERLFEYVDGTFSLFNHRHDAPRQAHSDENTPKPEPVQQDVTPPTEPEAPEPLPIGTRLTIDGRQYEVDSVDDSTQKVSLRDVTFENGTGFPIFRQESVEFVREHVEQPNVEQTVTQADEPRVVLTPPKKKKRNALAYPLDTNGRNYRITDDHIGEGTPLERFQHNLDAIRTLKTVETENRTATAEEQAVLAQYVGWGGLASFLRKRTRDMMS